MEISAVIAGLNYLPPGMAVWLSTDSQYVQKGVNEWMPKWNRNRWKNSKKAGIANRFEKMSRTGPRSYQDEPTVFYSDKYEFRRYLPKNPVVSGEDLWPDPTNGRKGIRSAFCNLHLTT
jgi:hypothetical protein